MKTYKLKEKEIKIYKLKSVLPNKKYKMERNYAHNLTFAEAFETKDYIVGATYDSGINKTTFFTLNKNTFEEKSFSVLKELPQALESMKDLKKARNFFEFWEVLIKGNPHQFQALPKSVFDKNNDNNKYLQRFISLAKAVVKQKASDPPKEADFTYGKQVLDTIVITIKNNQEAIEKENAEKTESQKKYNEQKEKFNQLLQQFPNVDDDAENS